MWRASHGVGGRLVRVGKGLFSAANGSTLHSVEPFDSEFRSPVSTFGAIRDSSENHTLIVVRARN